MEISDELIERIAVNSRLKLSKEEVKQFKEDFEAVLSAFSKIKNADTSRVKPSIHPFLIKDFSRNDEVAGCVEKKKVLALSKHVKDGFFKGPKVL